MTYNIHGKPTRSSQRIKARRQMLAIPGDDMEREGEATETISDRVGIPLSQLDIDDISTRSTLREEADQQENGAYVDTNAEQVSANDDPGPNAIDNLLSPRVPEDAVEPTFQLEQGVPQNAVEPTLQLEQGVQDDAVEPTLQLEQIYPQAAEAIVVEAPAPVLPQEPYILPVAYDCIGVIPYEEFTSICTVVFVPAQCVKDYAKAITFIGQQIKNATSDDDKNIAYKWYYAFPQLFLTEPRNGNHTRTRITNLIRNRLKTFIDGRYQEVINMWKRRKEQEKEYSRRAMWRKKNADIDKIMFIKIKKGDMRRGIKMGMGYGLADSKDQEVRNQVLRRHPQEANPVREWQDDDQDEEIEVDREAIRAVLARQDMFAAPGVRGLRPHHIKCLYDSKAREAEEAFSLFIELGNKFWNRQMPFEERRRLAAGLVVCANKDKDKKDQRPIKMEDYDMQLWCKAEAIINKQLVVDTCLPEQLGLGIKAGVETMVLGMQMELELARQRGERKVLAKFDIYNAFQEFDRSYLIGLLDHVVEQRPDDISVKRLRKVAYSLMELSPSIYMRGYATIEQVCESKNGGGQGNALTPIFFALVINSVIKQLAVRYPQLLIKAIHDDINVFGDPDIIFGEFWNDFNQLLVTARLRLQQTKTQVYALASEAQNFPDWVLTPCVTDENGNHSYGIQLCKIPVGDKKYIEKCLEEKGTEVIRQIERVTRVVAARDGRLALATLHHSSQNLVDYFMRCSVPECAEAMGNRIDEVLKEMYVFSIGVNIFPDEGVDEFTQLRVTARMKNGGMGIRWIKERPNYVSAINLVFTQIAQSNTEMERAIWPSIATLTGTMEGQNRWQQLFEVLGQDNCMVKSIKYAWKKVMDQRDLMIHRIQEYEQDWQMSDKDIWKVMKQSDLSFGHEQLKLGGAINDAMQEFINQLLQRKVEVMDMYDPRATSYKATSECQIAQSLVRYKLTADLLQHIVLTDIELAEAFANYFGLESPISKGLRGLQIKAARTRIVDIYGHQLKCANGGIGGDQVRELHDEVNNYLVLIGKQLQGITCTGGKNNTVVNRFKDYIGNNAINEQEATEATKRDIQGMIPDMELDAHTAMPVDERDLDYRVNLYDVKTLAGGPTYMEASYGQAGRYAVNQREERVAKEYFTHARKLDQQYNGTVQGQVGPVEGKLLTYGVNGRVKGLVVGAYGECSDAVEQYINFVVAHKCRSDAEQSNRDRAAMMATRRSTIKSTLGLIIHRGWARVLIARARNLVVRETAGEAQQQEQEPEIEELMQLELLSQE